MRKNKIFRYKFNKKKYDLYIDCITLLKETEKDLNKWKNTLYSWIESCNIQDDIALKLIHRLSVKR